MNCVLEPLTEAARGPVVDLFNYYVENGFAAYPDRPVPYEFFDALLAMARGYPAAVVKDAAGEVVGFGLLRPYSPIPTFARTAEITYFLRPEATGQGVGKMLLDHLIEGARRKDIAHILASVSSLNEGSLRFHLKNGFTECGRLRGIGRKKGVEFDVVYCQRGV